MAVTTVEDRSPTPDVASFAAADGRASLQPTAAALEAALRTRAPALHGSTPLVRKLAVRVSRALGLDAEQQLMVDVCAQLRDVGMLGLPDAVILNARPLSPPDWALMNRHPELGAELLHSLPGMSRAAELVRAHHERWDGEGYPDGLRGEAIPLASRVVAVCDAFVAIATDRPHRRGAGAEGALDYIVQEAGAQFDPSVVDALVVVITGQDGGRSRTSSCDRSPGENGHAQSAANPARGRPKHEAELPAAIAELDLIPVFGPACERALAAAAFSGPLGHQELVSSIESDPGLTIAILRLAQSRGGTAGAGVAGAIASVSGEDLHTRLGALPRVSFPWQTGFEALLLRSRIHAQAVARATERLAEMIRPFERDELVAAALIHDVGKLLLARIWPAFAVAVAVRNTPEELVALERRELGYDHSSLSGLLTQRWGLPSRLVTAVAAHHSAHRPHNPATLVRLADMLVHHAHGDTVDRHLMLRLAGAFALPSGALREVVFDLPHPGGSARRRAEHSPLSTRETAILRLIAEGKRSAQIARELHLTESTVRSHLHNTFAKLEVPDRAQAVLKATELAWI